MLRRLVIVGLLGGVSWYVYRKVLSGGAAQDATEGPVSNGNRSAAANGITARARQAGSKATTTVRQVVTTAAAKARGSAVVDQAAAADREPSGTGAPWERKPAPREAQAA